MLQKRKECNSFNFGTINIQTKMRKELLFEGHLLKTIFDSLLQLSLTNMGLGTCSLQEKFVSNAALLAVV